ncbi:DoxX family protein [Hoyosella altamirensis]|uniref:Putative membrane protein YphA (DoxX/SURF4 family) n=1 Tax=Hoyosella altamirensis TaxID=616997 RepID=A0A839RRG9_9ACTN|nr:DoxX family protein [Hoyosella altamirensis]MBB3038696.1 putative membrane protein YphA (DoxX/SURF4 family) [Hoyosella altamirensis]
MLLRRIARPMLAGVFVANGVNTLRNPEEIADKAAPLVEYAHASLPADTSRKLPADPATVARINAAVQVGAGALLALGRTPRIASGVLAVTLVPTTVVQHPFWAETDSRLRAEQRSHFLKNVALLGGLLITASDTEGKPSVGWRARRLAGRATTAISTAAPAASSAGTSAEARAKLAEGWHTVAERAREVASEAGERGSELFEVAADRGSELMEAASKRGSEWYEAAADKAPDLYETAAEQASKWYSTAADRSAELAAKAADRGSDLAHRTAELAKDGSADVRAHIKHR